MDYRERTGVLLIADISGYTHYLERIPLAHAQTILADLLEATINEVIGSDVVLVHRLLKNHVALREYAALTDALVRRYAPGGLHNAIRCTESYDHLGEVPVWVWDLAAERAGRPIAPPA
jgi:hypothetical protein